MDVEPKVCPDQPCSCGTPAAELRFIRNTEGPPDDYPEGSFWACPLCSAPSEYGTVCAMTFNWYPMHGYPAGGETVDLSPLMKEEPRVQGALAIGHTTAPDGAPVLRVAPRRYPRDRG